MHRISLIAALLLSVNAAGACGVGGRITLDPSAPIMTKDTSSSTIWFSPTGRNGNSFPLVGVTGIPYCEIFTSGPLDIGPSLSLDGLSGLYDIYINKVTSSFPTPSASVGMVAVPWMSVPDAVYGGFTVNSQDMEGCPQYRCLYVGAVRVTGGKASCLLSVGMERTCDIWNYYNQAPLVLKVADPSPAYLIGSTSQATNLRSAMGCINRDCRFSATTLVGRPMDRISATMTYNVRGLHNWPYELNSNVAHSTQWGLDVVEDSNPIPCDSAGNLNVEITPSTIMNTGISSTAFCEPTADQVVGSHTFYMMEQQYWGYGQAWITPVNLMGIVRGMF